MRILRFLDKHFEEVFLLPGLAFIVIATGVEVFRRYVLNSPGAYTSEAVVYTFIWIVYLGVPYATREDRHITLDLLPESLGPTLDFWIRVVSNIIQICFLAFVAWQAVGLILFYRELGSVSDAMSLPLWVGAFCLPLGSSLGAIRRTQLLVQLVRRPGA